MIQQQRVVSIPPVFSVRHRAPAAAALSWWLAGGAPVPIAVYQPKGAASLAASYTNLANPGTYDAAPGVAPTWDLVNGWTFNGLTQYLKTGVVPTTASSAIIRVSNGVKGAGAAWTVFGAYGGATNKRFHIFPIVSTTNHRYGHGNYADGSGAVASGVLAIVPGAGYLNGAPDVSITAGVGPGVEAIIGGFNNNGTPYFDGSGSVQAIAIYDTSIAAYISALTTEINAL